VSSQVFSLSGKEIKLFKKVAQLTLYWACVPSSSRTTSKQGFYHLKINNKILTVIITTAVLSELILTSQFTQQNSWGEI